MILQPLKAFGFEVGIGRAGTGQSANSIRAQSHLKWLGAIWSPVVEFLSALLQLSLSFSSPLYDFAGSLMEQREFATY